MRIQSFNSGHLIRIDDQKLNEAFAKMKRQGIYYQSAIKKGCKVVLKGFASQAGQPFIGVGFLPKQKGNVGMMLLANGHLSDLNGGFAQALINHFAPKNTSNFSVKIHTDFCNVKIKKGVCYFKLSLID